MALHVIVGAGPVGSTTARLLAERGERIRLVSRRGSGPDHPAIERIAADATDAERLTELTTGSVALYNCANPAYHAWLTDWPPLAAALLTAAERSGPVLATVANLYPYGEVDGPITEATPFAATHPKLRLRGELWRDALAGHRAGRIRATEVRGSDYLEANSIFTVALAKPMLAGRRAYSPAPLDVPHSFTSITDVARAVIAAADRQQAWGQAWHVPTNPPTTVRALATRFAEVHGAPRARLGTIPYPALWTVGLFSPMVRELRTTRYQFSRPFVLDSAHSEQVLGLTPTDLDVALKAIRVDRG